MASTELLDWCLSNGITCHGIQSGYVADGWRGILATKDLEADACILRVPQQLLLTAKSARRDPLLRRVLEREGRHLFSNQVLAIHLLHEVSKGVASFWWPYLQSLPRSYGTAMCFRPADVEALQLPYAQQAAQHAVEVCVAQWREALPVLRALGLPPKWNTRQAWLWAASTLSSRTMYVPFDPAGALTPLGDLHNYAPPPPPYTPDLSALRSQPQPHPKPQLKPKPLLAQPQLRQEPAAAGAGGLVGAMQRLQLSSGRDGGLAHPQQEQQRQQEHDSDGRAGQPLACSAGSGTIPPAGHLLPPAPHPQQQLQLQPVQEPPPTTVASRIHRPNPSFQRRSQPPNVDPGTQGACPAGAGTAEQASLSPQQPGNARGSTSPASAAIEGSSCCSQASEGRPAGVSSPAGPAPADGVAQGFTGCPAGGAASQAQQHGCSMPGPSSTLASHPRAGEAEAHSAGGGAPQLQRAAAGEGAASAPAAEGGLERKGAPWAPAVDEGGGGSPLGGGKGVDAQQGQQIEAEDGGLCGDGFLDQEAGEYRIFVRRRYGKGEQVFLCYGRHTNLELLEHYGFVLPGNPHDTAVLPGLALPQEVAEKLPSPQDAYVHHDGTPSWELLRVLRLAGATSAERKSRAYLALEDAPISTGSEGRALAMLHSACAATLRSLPTSAQQDEQAVAQQMQALGECARLAVEWRLGYKRILQRCMGLCEEALLHMEPPSSDNARRERASLS